MTTENETVDKMKDGSEIIPTTFDNRENLLFKLEEVIDYLYNKALNGRDGHVDVIKNSNC